jgi:hypothetical protein
MTGTGGASKMINGVELWLTGSPPRRFQIIGYITDSRPGGPPSMAMRDGAVAAEARAKGGDGVLMHSDDSQYMGTVSTASVSMIGSTAFGHGASVPITRRNGTYYVIKYL